MLITGNIGILGDSIYKGTVYNNNTGRYAFNSESYISDIESEYNVHIINSSRLGLTTGKALERGLHLSLASQCGNSGLVFLSLGGNDSDFDWVEVGKTPDKPHYPRTSPEVFASNITSLVNDLRGAGMNVIVLGLVPIHSQKFFDHLSLTADGNGVLKWLGCVQRTYMWQEYYNDLLRETAEALKAPFINVRRAFISYPHIEGLVCEDGIHLTKEGYDLLVETLIGDIKAL